VRALFPPRGSVVPLTSWAYGCLPRCEFLPPAPRSRFFPNYFQGPVDIVLQVPRLDGPEVGCGLPRRLCRGCCWRFSRVDNPSFDEMNFFVPRPFDLVFPVTLTSFRLGSSSTWYAGQGFKTLAAPRPSQALVRAWTFPPWTSLRDQEPEIFSLCPLRRMSSSPIWSAINLHLAWYAIFGHRQTRFAFCVSLEFKGGLTVYQETTCVRPGNNFFRSPPAGELEEGFQLCSFVPFF